MTENIFFTINKVSTFLKQKKEFKKIELASLFIIKSGGWGDRSKICFMGCLHYHKGINFAYNNKMNVDANSKKFSFCMIHIFLKWKVYLHFHFFIQYLWTSGVKFCIFCPFNLSFLVSLLEAFLGNYTNCTERRRNSKISKLSCRSTVM